MTRRVKAVLTADISDLQQKMRVAANEVRRPGKAADESARDMDRMGKAAADASDKAGRAAKGLGKDMRDAGTTGAAALGLSEKAAANLDRQIAETAREVQRLERQFRETGDLSLFDDLGKQMKKLQGQVKARDFFNPTEVADAGARAAAGAATSFGLNLGPLMTKLPMGGGAFAAYGAAIGLPIAVGVTSVLATAVAGAVVGAAGVGGIAGGIALAAHDPRVKAEAAELGTELLTMLQDAASNFVPVTRAVIRDLRMEVGQFQPYFERIFAGAAKLVEPLLDGLKGLAHNALPGIVDAIERAGPIFDVLADRLPEVGDAITDALRSMSGDANSAAAGVDTILAGLIGIVRFGGSVIGFFTDMFRVVVNVADAALTVAETLAGWNPIIAPQLERSREHINHLNQVLDGTGTAARGAGFDLAGLGGAAGQTADEMAEAKEQTDALKDAFDRLFGAQMSIDRATIAYKEGLKSLRAELIEGKRLLDVNSQAGRENRGAVLNQIDAIGDLRESRIANNMTVEEANRKYDRELQALRKTLIQMGFNKKQVDALVGAYRKIPEKANTTVGLVGEEAVRARLQTLYAYQNALRIGKPMADIKKQLSRDNADFLKFDTGGWTGPGDTHQPAGIVHADEFVLRKSSRRRIEQQHPGLLDEMNATGQLPPGYARGGWVWPYPTNVSRTRIPSQREVASKVPFQFGQWPSGPSAQRGDSGVWRQIVALINSTGPLSGSFGNGYRPGDPLWHGSGRALDWMGFNQDALAAFLAARRPLELIHRTNRRDYAYTRGVNQGSFDNALMEAHRNHIHIAMANGGIIGEPVYGIGRSGTSYSFAENGPEAVTPLWRAGNPAAPSAASTGGARTVVVEATIPIQLDGETITRRVRLVVDTVLGQLADAHVYGI